MGKLTPAQVATVKAYLDSDPMYEQKFLHGWDGCLELAEYLNKTRWTPEFIVWRTNTSIESILSNGFTWSAVDTLTVGKARIWEWMSALGYINASKPNVRQGLQDCFGSSQPNLAAHLKRPALIIEKLLATGTGTTASPATMSWEGPVSMNDMVDVWFPVDPT
jgi:hypothetical protein